MSGFFVTVEGGDATGKTTQIAALSQWLSDRGHEVVATREPGGTDVGLELREVVLHWPGHIADRAEALIYAADRAHHVATVVRPALERGAVVLQDRYVDSSVVYQGVGRGLGEDEVRSISSWATEGLTPDLTLLFDIPESVARERLGAANRRFDRLEAEGGAFHSRVRDAFLALAAAEPERFVVIDASGTPDQVTAAASAALAARLDGVSGAN